MEVYVWGSVGEGNGACVKAGLPDHQKSRHCLL